ncbi:MAG: creatininase family protein [Lentisphaerae bacterium]|nr:creatininase family protein [Lentisphaerota bacterium]
MQKKVVWHEMFKDEFEAALATRPVCYLSFGLSEPHGVQNAMGLDGLKAYTLVQRAAEAHGGIVAPPVWWHVHETPLSLEWLATQNAPKPYLTCVPPDLFLRQLVYQLRAVEAAGFRAAICVTGHYGGIEVDMNQVCQIYSARRPLRAVALSDWEAIRYKDYHGDHAGLCETSQLWALRPEMVDISRIPEEPFEGPLFASSHYARRSSRREGEAIVSSQVIYLKTLSDELLRQAEGRPAPQRISFDDAEKIWEEMLADRPNWILSRLTFNNEFWDYVRERRKRFPLPIE